MNFTGDQLVRLLQDVRKHLRRQGQEMVLLIEDLARLQGLDLSLLEALIEEGSEEQPIVHLALGCSGNHWLLRSYSQTR